MHTSTRWRPSQERRRAPIDAAWLLRSAMIYAIAPIAGATVRAMAEGRLGNGAAARAVAWLHGKHAAVCDRAEPWAHGTVVRASRYPSYYDFNVVRVEQVPAIGAEDLTAFADEALVGLSHRRVDFDDARAAEPLRAGFEARGWTAQRLVWMRHEGRREPDLAAEVVEVPYDAVHDLRVAWFEEESPGRDTRGYHAQARDVAMRRHTRVLAVCVDELPVAFAQLEHDGDAAEITEVFVRRDQRGNGRGTAVTRAAIGAAGDVRDLWICADDQGRPKELYGRLGFCASRTTIEFLRVL